jgi:AraC-like DNA-binding protein
VAYVPALVDPEECCRGAIYLHVCVATETVQSRHPDLIDPEAQHLEKMLGKVILAALMQGFRSTDPFVSHLAIALCSLKPARAARSESHTERGGLRPWQESMAKSMLSVSAGCGASIARVAAACGLSESYFGRAFRRSVGMPPHRWMVMQRLERAMTLLGNTDQSLASIAAECGFCDQSHMNHLFLKIVGASPGACRDQKRALIDAKRHAGA